MVDFFGTVLENRLNAAALNLIYSAAISDTEALRSGFSPASPEGTDASTADLGWSERLCGELNRRSQTLSWSRDANSWPSPVGPAVDVCCFLDFRAGFAGAAPRTIAMSASIPLASVPMDSFLIGVGQAR